MPPREELNQRLQALWKKFRPEILSRLETIAQAIAALQDNALSDRLKAEATHAAHKLAGSLGTFGLHEGSRAAQEIELTFSQPDLRTQACDKIRKHFDQLKEEIEKR